MLKVIFFLSDEGELMGNVRSYLQTIFPVCGDLLLGETKIRRVPVGEVNVPKGAHVLISNNRHAFTPSSPEDMRLRRDSLLDHKFQYHLFNLNCEHFATFVRYGKAVCNQVSIWHCKIQHPFLFKSHWFCLVRYNFCFYWAEIGMSDQLDCLCNIFGKPRSNQLKLLPTVHPHLSTRLPFNFIT